LTTNHDHKVGRPLRATHATSNITLRLTEEERSAVEAHVEKTGKPRAVLIREAMEAFGLFTLPRKRG
jgi:predicted DNA binding CopG/RHH family protein